MMIFVRTLTGCNMRFDIDGVTTVDELKDLITLKNGILPVKQRLVMCGKELLDGERMLADYNVRDETTLHLITRLRGQGHTVSIYPARNNFLLQSLEFPHREYCDSTISDKIGIVPGEHRGMEFVADRLMVPPLTFHGRTDYCWRNDQTINVTLHFNTTDSESKEVKLHLNKDLLGQMKEISQGYFKARHPDSSSPTKPKMFFQLQLTSGQTASISKSEDFALYPQNSTNNIHVAFSFPNVTNSSKFNRCFELLQPNSEIGNIAQVRALAIAVEKDLATISSVPEHPNLLHPSGVVRGDVRRSVRRIEQVVTCVPHEIVLANFFVSLQTLLPRLASPTGHSVVRTCAAEIHAALVHVHQHDQVHGCLTVAAVGRCACKFFLHGFTGYENATKVMAAISKQQQDYHLINFKIPAPETLNPALAGEEQQQQQQQEKKNTNRRRERAETKQQQKSPLELCFTKQADLWQFGVICLELLDALEGFELVKESCAAGAENIEGRILPCYDPDKVVFKYRGISSKLLKCAKCCLKTNPFERMYCNLILQENDDDYEKDREENEELKVKKEEDVCG